MNPDTAEPDPRLPPEAGRAELAIVGVLTFFTGASVLSLEILGGRVLQPEFGSGVHAWGSILSVFMVSLAIGYWLGGKLSAKRASLKILMIFPFLGGCIIYLLPDVYSWMNDALFDLVVIEWDWHESYASLLAAMGEFLLPSAILGCVSPYSVRLLARTVITSGRTAGNLYALSTVGSTVGALGTSFWLIPLSGVESLFQMLGGGLVGLSALGLILAVIVGRKRV